MNIHKIGTKVNILSGEHKGKVGKIHTSYSYKKEMAKPGTKFTGMKYRVRIAGEQLGVPHEHSQLELHESALNELSQKTKQNYIDAAEKSKVALHNKSITTRNKAMSSELDGDKETSDAMRRDAKTMSHKAIKRIDGISRAMKESTDTNTKTVLKKHFFKKKGELSNGGGTVYGHPSKGEVIVSKHDHWKTSSHEGSMHHSLDKHLSSLKESTLNELSSKTLGSYLKKASGSMKTSAMKYGRRPNTDIESAHKVTMRSRGIRNVADKLSKM